MGLDTKEFLEMRVVDFTQVLYVFLSFSKGGQYSAADLEADVPDPGERVGRGLFLYYKLRNRQGLGAQHALWPRGLAD